MSLNNFSTKSTADKKTSKRVGRGGKRGKTSGKGHKGQKARAGGTPRPAYRDVIKKIPKLRGHGVNRSRTINPNRVKPQAVTLSAINEAFKSGDAVNPQTLFEHGLLDRGFTGVKILATGSLDKKLSFTDVVTTDAAQKKITESGSTLK